MGQKDFFIFWKNPIGVKGLFLKLFLKKKQINICKNRKKLFSEKVLLYAKNLFLSRIKKFGIFFNCNYNMIGQKRLCFFLDQWGSLYISCYIEMRNSKVASAYTFWLILQNYFCSFFKMEPSIVTHQSKALIFYFDMEKNWNQKFQNFVENRQNNIRVFKFSVCLHTL